MADLTVGLAVPGVPAVSSTVDLRDVRNTLKKVLVKTFAALIAGGALACNLWVAGILNSGQPVHDFSLKFFLIVLAQAGIVTYVVALSNVLAVDVAAGILGGTLIIIVVDVAGAFRGAFDLGQFVGQLVVAYFAVVAVAVGTAVLKGSPPSVAPSQDETP